MKNILFITCLFLSYSLFGQYTDTASMRIIEQNKSANEGDLYLDTIAKVYKIGLINGKLGWITDKQLIDSIAVMGDSLLVFLQRGNKASVLLDSLNISEENDNAGLNYFMWDIANTSTPNITNKRNLGIPTGQGSVTAELNNTHRNLIAASPQEGYIINYSGVIKVRNTGNFTFTSRSDDGTRVYIDGVMVLENWFQQSPTTRSATINLSKGEHLIEFWYYENSGGDYMEFFWGANPDGYVSGSIMRGDQFFIK